MRGVQALKDRLFENYGIMTLKGHTAGWFIVRTLDGRTCVGEV